MVWYEKLNSIVAALYEIKTLSHIRIGSGENIKLPTPVDNPQTRVLKLEPGKVEGKWIVYIPASSIHGLLRSALEDYLRTQFESIDSARNAIEKVGQNSRIGKEIKKYLDSIPGFEDLPLYREVCYTTFSFDSCQIPPSNEDKEKYLVNVVSRKSGDKHLPCFVCQLFGAAGLRSRIRILNAYPSGATIENLPLDVITRVAINRVTGTAEEGRLFDLEAIPPGAVFYFFVVINNSHENVKLHDGSMSEKDYRDKLGVQNLNYLSLFERSIKLVGRGLVPIGAHGSVGFGNVEITEIARFEADKAESARKFVRILVDHQKPEDLSNELKSFVKVERKEIPELNKDLYPQLARLLVLSAKSEKKGDASQ